MIKQNKFQILTDETESQYKFGFCNLCEFYECELVREYMQFKENHLKSWKPDHTATVTATVVKDSGTDNDIAAKKTKVQVLKVNSYASSTKKNNSDIDYLSYDKEELKNGCIMSGRYINQVECGIKKVADGIGDAFKINTRYNSKIENDTNKWEPNQPVFISAQTGKGKNYFIEETLLPYIRDLNRENRTDQKVLIISNRRALCLQIESRLSGMNDQDFEEDRVYSYGEYADVMSYQSLLNNLSYLVNKQEKNESSYIFVVCDEAHFFTSDAMFSPDTEKILHTIVNTFKDAIRIYMSATPYECLEYINKYEGENKVQPCMGVLYHFKRDYSYLNIKYYAQFTELENIIINSVSKENKRWLIFLDDIDKCENLKNTLENCAEMKGKVFTVNAKSKYNTKYQNMVLGEALGRETKVLIATSVLDNGVNFRGIDNIVISDTSKVKCLQMVGRCRVENNNEKITLYIKRFNKKYIENRIEYLKKQQDAYHSYDLAYDKRNSNYELEFLNKYYNNEPDDWKNAKHWFGRDKEQPTKLYFNVIARDLVDKFRSRYERILEEMNRTDEGKKITGQRYLEYQLSWFGKQYDEESDITLVDKGKSEKEFVSFLESYSVNQTKIFDDGQKAFSEEFTKLHDTAFSRKDPNKGRVYGISKMKKILEEYNMNYMIEAPRETSGDKKTTYWKVVKFNRESDESKSE